MLEIAAPARLVAALLCLFLLAGCGAQLAQMAGIPIVDPTDKAAIAAETQIEVMEAYGNTRISGPVIFHDRNLGGNFYRIRTWVDEGDALDGLFQVVVTAQLREWVQLNQAYSGGEQLEMNRLDRYEDCNKSGCRYTEVVGILLSLEQAKQYADVGMSFRVSGVRGSLTMTIPPEYFSVILDEYLKLKAA